MRMRRIQHCRRRLSTYRGWWVALATLVAWKASSASGSPPLSFSLQHANVTNMADQFDPSYDSMGYVDISCKLHHSVLDGPGSFLMGGIFSGDTVARETFVTQLVFDVSSAVSIATSRVYVVQLTAMSAVDTMAFLRVVENDVLGSEASVLEVLSELTRQAQDPNSPLFDGLVSAALDPLFGVVALDLDAALRVQFALDVIGGPDSVLDGSVINEGAKQRCLGGFQSIYCEWEWWFRDDLSSALELSIDQVQVIFVKDAGKGLSMVHFRLLPQSDLDIVGGADMTAYLLELLSQVGSMGSPLFAGNVTLAVDPGWGVSGVGKLSRPSNPFLPMNYYAPPPSKWQDTPYERCKDLQACARGESTFDSSTLSYNFGSRAFRGGAVHQADLFADFEDWRAGSWGWTHSLSVGSTLDPWRSKPTVKGAHYVAADFVGNLSGPTVATVAGGTRFNRGLVLDAQRKDRDLWLLASEEEFLVQEAEWALEFRDTALFGASHRSREDVRSVMDKHRMQLLKQLDGVSDTLASLNGTQCSAWGGLGCDGPPYAWWDDGDGSGAASHPCNCSLLFNTSSLEMTGAINATGYALISPGPEGVETAVWAFEQVYLGPEIAITVVGQRPLAIISLTALVLNTSIEVLPGTLGGFPGGGSIARQPSDALVDDPMPISLAELIESGGVLPGNSSSNNINGPGSNSLRHYQFTVTSRATDVDESQRVCVGVTGGQKLGGCFVLSYRGRKTTCLPYDVSASSMRRAISGDLNQQDPLDPRALANERSEGYLSGVGLVEVVASSGQVAAELGRCWQINFISALGDMDTLELTSFLTGMGSWASVEVLQEGNSIGGSFQLRFQGYSRRHTTLPLSHDATSDEVRTALLSLPGVEEVQVERSTPTADCDDGLCQAPPTPGGGHTWTIDVVTRDGNLSPPSPTSALAQEEGDELFPTAVSSLSGQGAEIVLQKGFSSSPDKYKAAFNTTRVFSIALGGAGGGYGGKGGAGHGPIGGFGPSYGDPAISDLLGGSGGSRGGSWPYDVFGAGEGGAGAGAGGGAVELVAGTDITIGVLGNLNVNGGPGEEGWDEAGGGGSGGSIVLVAAGHVALAGYVSAKGGLGGTAQKAGSANPGGGGSGGRVAIYGHTISRGADSHVSISGGACMIPSLCNGEKGTLFLSSDAPGMAIFVDREREGARDTNSSLWIQRYSADADFAGDGEETRLLLSHKSKLYDGPEWTFPNASLPSRVSLMVKFDMQSEVECEGTSVALVSLLSNAGVNVSDAIDGSAVVPKAQMLGVSLGEEGLFHGANFSVAPTETAVPDFSEDHWYHIDILLSWDELGLGGSYTLRIDGAQYADSAPFGAPAGGVTGLGLYVRGCGALQVDEVFVGRDFTMGFRCPTSTGSVVSWQDHPNWSLDPLEPTTKSMVRHENFLSEWSEFTKAVRPGGGYLPVFDGNGGIQSTADQWTMRELGGMENGADAPPLGNLQMGALLNPRDGKVDSGEGRNRTYFYNSFTNAGASEIYLRGGVGVCSTTDFFSWKFEGIALHSANLTDMALANTTGLSDDDLHFFMPKVAVRGVGDSPGAEEEAAFIMWGTIDERNGSRGMAGTASSRHPEGPFLLRRSFFPDGNETHDQTIFQDDSGAFLIRSYFADEVYELPDSVMQPVWESVKNADGSVNFGLNYHRAFYHPGYDDYHDIYLQRWRMEDRPWEIACVDRITGESRTLAYGESGEFGLCNQPQEYKLLLGQGMPVIQSRFKNPNNPENSVWQPSSVPSVKAQPWERNYQDGLCGLRNLDDDIAWDDPILASHNVTVDRSNCSNIADNPPHGTLPDSLTGPAHAVQTRRAKYIAMSRLTPDLLDSSGVLRTFEGGLEGSESMLSLLGLMTAEGNLLQPFVFSAGEELGSTYRPVVDSEFHTDAEYSRRAHQFEARYNDRATYSAACLIDGTCPLDFRIT